MDYHAEQNWCKISKSLNPCFFSRLLLISSNDFSSGVGVLEMDWMYFYVFLDFFFIKSPTIPFIWTAELRKCLTITVSIIADMFPYPIFLTFTPRLSDPNPIFLVTGKSQFSFHLQDPLLCPPVCRAGTIHLYFCLSAFASFSVAGLYVTWWPCWWSRIIACLSTGN